MEGLTLRDHFAASVDVGQYDPLDAYRQVHGKAPTMEALAKCIAAIRYIEADAMMKERERR